MKHCLITIEASRNIIKQSRKSDVETGGILIGILEPVIIIINAGCPGDNAVRRVTQFTSDPQADQICLANAHQMYGDCVVPMGWWHKHPAGFNKPSFGDCQQIHQLTQDYADGKPVFMGIVNQIPALMRQKTTLHLYSVDPDDNIVESPWNLISNKNPVFIQALNKAPIRPPAKHSDYWADNNFQSYLNPVGRERIKKEVENLRLDGWQVTTGRHPQDKVLILELAKDSTALRLVLAPEFPLNPPCIFTPDGRCFQGLHSLDQWNSQKMLVEVAAEAMMVSQCSRCSRQCLTTTKT